MKLLNFNLFKATVTSPKGNFIREINIKADNIEEALVIAKEVAGDSEVGSISKTYYTNIEAATKHITIDL